MHFAKEGRSLAHGQQLAAGANKDPRLSTPTLAGLACAVLALALSLSSLQFQDPAASLLSRTHGIAFLHYN